MITHLAMHTREEKLNDHYIMCEVLEERHVQETQYNCRKKISEEMIFELRRKCPQGNT